MQNEMLGSVNLDWYDYGARMYDPSLGRFHTIDPLTELFIFQSPFLYAYNNPVRFIEFKGMNAEDRTKRKEKRKQRKAERRGNRKAEKEDIKHVVLEEVTCTRTQTTEEKYNSKSWFEKKLIEDIFLVNQAVNYWSDFLGGPTGEDVNTFDKLEYQVMVYATGKFLIISSRGINQVKRKLKIPKGFNLVPGVKSKGQPVFKKRNKYITPDVDSHKGGLWKMADSPKNLGSKQTRTGTYNEDLTRKIDN